MGFELSLKSTSNSTTLHTQIFYIVVNFNLLVGLKISTILMKPDLRAICMNFGFVQGNFELSKSCSGMLEKIVSVYSKLACQTHHGGTTRRRASWPFGWSWLKLHDTHRAISLSRKSYENLWIRANFRDMFKSSSCSRRFTFTRIIWCGFDWVSFVRIFIGYPKDMWRKIILSKGCMNVLRLS